MVITKKKNVLILLSHLILLVSNVAKGEGGSESKNNLICKLLVTSMSDSIERQIPKKQSSLLFIQGGGITPESNNNNATSVFEVFENEEYDFQQKIWYGSEYRWTTTNGGISDPPTSLKSPRGYEFSSNWKIDVSGSSRDSMGWEYFVSPDKRRSMRQRRWLRTLTSITVVDASKNLTHVTSTNKSKTGSSSKKKLKKGKVIPRVRLPHPIRASKTIVNNFIDDQFNFKGFGLSVYKSLIFPTSFGALLRSPITLNFDFWERRPYLPSISTSGGFFGSRENFTLVSYLSFSIPIEVITFLLHKLWSVAYLIYWIFSEFIQSILHVTKVIIQLTIGNILKICWNLFLIVRGRSDKADKNNEKVSNEEKKKKKQTVSSILAYPSSIKYSTEVQNRVGFSLSWRVSIKYGYEFRITYSHSYLPTIEYILLNVAPKKSKVLMSSAWRSWLKERTGSFGTSTGYPIPDTPPFSSSAVFSLSGLYFRDSSFSKLTSSIPTTTTLLQEGKSEEDKITSTKDNLNSSAVSSVKKTKTGEAEESVERVQKEEQLVTANNG